MLTDLSFYFHPSLRVALLATRRHRIPFNLAMVPAYLQVKSRRNGQVRDRQIGPNRIEAEANVSRLAEYKVGGAYCPPSMSLFNVGEIQVAAYLILC